jgi:hypothetical protein
MMNRYDPDQTPNPKEWLALDEQIRIGLVEKYHRWARVELPNVTIHAAFHAIVENQLAGAVCNGAEGLTRQKRCMQCVPYITTDWMNQC